MRSIPFMVLRVSHPPRLSADRRSGLGCFQPAERRLEFQWALIAQCGRRDRRDERTSPNAGKARGWPWVLPAWSHDTDRITGAPRRPHLHESGVQQAIHAAWLSAGIVKPARRHSLRHSFAPHLREDGSDRRPVRERLGRTDARTTLIDTHTLNRGGRGVRRPADVLTQSLTPRSYHGTLQIGRSRRPCAVEILDTPAISDKNRAIV
jgi:hypothetical protein